METIISASDIGAWAINVGTQRVGMAQFGVGLVPRQWVGRRVFRAGGTWHLESDQQRRAREVSQQVLFAGL